MATESWGCVGSTESRGDWKRGVLLHLGDDLHRSVAERRAVVADQRELQAVAGAANAEAVGLHRKDAHARHLPGEPADLGHDLLLAAVALVPWRQRHHHEAGIVGAVPAGALEGIADFAGIAQRLDQFLDLLHLLRRVVEADALRRVDAHEHDGTILGRRQFLANRAEQREGGGCKQQRDQEHDPRRIEADAQAAPVERVQRAADAGADAAAAFVMKRRDRQHARGKHRTKGQRHDGGQKHRYCENEAEFAKQAAGLAGQEGDRHEHGDQRQRRGDDGEEHFLGAKHGRGAWPHAFVASSHDIFQNDDGVIDDQARRQHQGEQRQYVDREAGEIDGGDRPDHGDRHRKPRNERRAPVEEKHVDDDQHD